MIGYCSLLDKSGNSGLALLEGVEIITKEVDHELIDKVWGITKRLIDAENGPNIVEALGNVIYRRLEEGKAEERAMGVPEYIALDLEHFSSDSFNYVRCLGPWDEEKEETVPNKEFKIGPEYCKSCEFYEERD